jgi:pyruvate dehydrogenase E2 component (dihydrolipoamide acetyltransferase)
MSTSSAVAVQVPDIGDFEDVPIIEIHVSDGDTVAVDDPLVTLESDKATMDVPAPFAGKVTEVIVGIGDKVSEGSELLRIEPSEEAPTGTKAAAATSDTSITEADAPDAVASAADAEAQEPAVEQPGGGAGSAPGPQADGRRREPSGDGDGAGGQSQTEAAPPTEAKHDGGGPVYASPSVRRLARELSVDLQGVQGSGRKGRITKDDVQRAASGDGQPSAAGAPAGTVPTGGEGLNLLPWPQIDFSKFGEVERVQRSRIQRISAPNLARNWVMIPHVTHNDEADITELEAWRKQLNAEQKGDDAVKFTMVSFLIAASVATLKVYPTFNASLDGEELVLKHFINIGFAADTPGGLVVPVIKNAAQKGLVEIARELAELSGKARAGKLAPGDMQGATFTISSLGGIGGTSFTPIINAPEVAILGVTRAAMKPVWDGSEFKPRLMVPLSLSYDHRVIDGAAAARFMVHLVGVLSDLRRALL